MLYILFSYLFYKYNTFSTLIYLYKFVRLLHPLMVASQNTSCSTEHDSLNHTPHSGHQILLPSPFQGGREEISLLSPFHPVVPTVPQPMGTINIAPPHLFPHLLAFPTPGHPLGFPSTPPGQLPVGHSLQSREYNVLSNSHPVQGERQNNHMSQGENFNANSHNSSGWSSGFTNVLQDLSLDLGGVRQSSPHIESRTQVSHSNTFQQIYTMSRDILENIYFSLNSFFDIAQIRNLEDSYRNLDTQIERLIPHISHQTNEFNVQNMIHAMRNLQNKIEDKLINFYQNLSERDQIKVVFSLPQLQNLFICSDCK